MGNQYLLYWAHRLLDFREAELHQLLDLWHNQQGLQGAPQAERLSLPEGHPCLSPFRLAQLASEAQAQWICSHSLLLKGVYELLGWGSDLEGLKASLQAAVAASPDHFAQWAGTSFKVIVDTWGHATTLEEQVRLIEELNFLPFKGQVRLKDPEVTFRLVIVKQGIAAENGLPEFPPTLFFGRHLAEGNRGVINAYALPQRVYLGPTSMDTEMAFIMCNFAQVRKGSLVYDPFAGTGSILVAAGHLGAVTLGSDIDAKVIRDGRQGADGQHRDVWSNFAAYSLQPPVGLLRSDSHRPPFHAGLEEVLDAIITDPPYGVRAGGRKSTSTERKNLLQNGRRQRAPGRPATEAYSLAETLADLLHLAARLLRVGGRLVVFLPSLPGACMRLRHPCLSQLASCEQVLSTRYSRNLLLLKKTRAFNAAASLAVIAEQRAEFAALDEIHDVVFESKAREAAGLCKPAVKLAHRSKLI